jgi:hypothetical protein
MWTIQLKIPEIPGGKSNETEVPGKKFPKIEVAGNFRKLKPEFFME